MARFGSWFDTASTVESPSLLDARLDCAQH
jgi:hypothetical protein